MAQQAAAAGGAGLRPPAGRWLFQTSAYTLHFNPDPSHTNKQRGINIEYWAPNKWLFGAAHLRNSFNQPTQYIFTGRLWRPLDSQPMLYVKLTGGLLYGYKGEFRGKIPFNHYGVAPALVPSLGVSVKHFTAEVMLLGAAAAMVNVGVLW